jgi:radical SAM superfamily enzyme YgiQ (UPF0313 family)
MPRRKLILVNPALSNPFPGFQPLGLGYVAALTPDSWDIEVLDENFSRASYKPCDLVGLTGFTAYANRAYQVARMFKRRGVPVVMGGIHASMMPEEALGHVDTVVIGEAESVWPEVIADFEAGKLKRRYEGVHTDLKGLPIPRRDLFDERYIGDSIQTTRGCPQDCDFCSVSQFNGFTYRQRPVDEVLDEMETLERKYLLIVDDNIVGSGASRARYAIDLCRGMIERKLDFAWYSHAALNVADDEEVLRAFSESGCRLLFLGMEAENRDVLESMKKNVNLKRDYETVIRKLHDHHIGIHGSFIFGTDEDSIEMLERRFEYMMQTHIDVVQHCTLTPYPGTRLFDRLLDEGRLFHTRFPSDWDRYDLTEITFKPHHLDLDDYAGLMRRVSNEAFSHRSVARRFLRTWRDTSKLHTALWCLFANELYSTPRWPSSGNDEKFWTLSRRMLPVINMYQRIERRF